MISEGELNSLIAKTYAVALEHDQWLPLLDFTTDVFGGVGTSFEIFDKKSGDPLFLELGSGLKHVSAPEYVDYYGHISPRVRHAEKVKSGEVTYDYAILSEAEMQVDEFYNDCMAPMGLRYFVAGHLLDGNGYLGALAVQLSARQGHVDQARIELMRTMLPHIQQAVDLKYRLAGTAVNKNGLLECLEELAEAAILLGGDGKILHANSAAQDIFTADDGVAFEDGRISFRATVCNDKLERALDGVIGFNDAQETATETSFIAPRQSGARPYLVSVRRLPKRSERFDIPQLSAAAIVFIRDPGTYNRLDTDLLAESHNLSATEVQIAVALDQGHSIKEIARQRGVAATTVRSQVYALMAKLLVKRQVDLIRVLGQYRRPFS